MAEISLWIILWLSFITALSGAMAPGPLLTYTIIKSMQSKKKGYFMGFFIIVGHAILELVIIFLLLKGLNYFLQNEIVILSIGILGSLILILMGTLMLRDIALNKIPVNFLPERRGNNEKSIRSNKESELLSMNLYKEKKEDNENKQNKEPSQKIFKNPIFGGIMVSASNPYWWVWWATIGFAFMLEYNISFSNWNFFLSFYVGHESGDLLWYLFVSIAVYYGKSYINKKLYYGVLGLCALFMIVFGIYLIISIMN